MALFRYSYALTIFVLLFLATQLSIAKPTEILDNEEEPDFVSIARIVCETTRGTSKQIGNPNTIGTLTRILKISKLDHELTACARKYLPAFEQLEFVLNSGNDDICGADKIGAIEKFHQSFLSRLRKKEKNANKLVAPQILKLFFMHYVSAISNACERYAVQELSVIKYVKIDNQKIDESVHIDKMMNLFGMLDSTRGYKDMFLVWNFVDSLPIDEDSKLSRYIHKGETRIYLQVQKANTLTAIQEACRYRLKPFYSSSLLAVIRLSDLGFYPESPNLASKLSKDKNYNDLYSLIQLCETFLPLKVIRNENLKPQQVILLSREDVASIELPVNHKEIPKQSGKVVHSKNEIDVNRSILSDDEQYFIKRVKAEVKSRSHYQNKILKNMIKRFERESSYKSAELTLSNGSTKEDLELLLKDSLKDLKEAEPSRSSDAKDKEVVKLHKGHRFMNIVRRVLAGLFLPLLVVGYITLWVTMWLVKIFILAPIALITSIFYLISKVDGPLEFMLGTLEYKLPKLSDLLEE